MIASDNTRQIGVCHVHAVAMDFDLTPGKHAQCPNSPPAQFSGKGQMFLGALPSFFFAIKTCSVGLGPYSRGACSVS